MAIRDVIKVSRKTFFNPRAWLGLDSIKDQTRVITSFVKDAVNVQEPERRESFEQARQRLDLNEADLRTGAKTYLIYAIVFLSLAIIDLIYSFYLLFRHHTFLGLVLAITVCALLLAQAFKYHFWWFQIKHRKLGCSFDEWRKGKVQKSVSSGREV